MAGVLCLCEGFLNIPLMGMRGYISYNPVLSSQRKPSCLLLYEGLMKITWGYFRKFVKYGIE